MIAVNLLECNIFYYCPLLHPASRKFNVPKGTDFYTTARVSVEALAEIVAVPRGTFSFIVVLIEVMAQMLPMVEVVVVS